MVLLCLGLCSPIIRYALSIKMYVALGISLARLIIYIANKVVHIEGSLLSAWSLFDILFFEVAILSTPACQASINQYKISLIIISWACDVLLEGRSGDCF